MEHINHTVIDQKGDVELLVQDFRFLVSSSKMAAISPQFRKLFSLQEDQSPVVELPHEDPILFRLICQLAHGLFVPQCYISLKTLVSMAEAIIQYGIPHTSKIHHTVEYCFIVQTVKPGIISLDKLVKLLQVAMILSPIKARQLLEDVFILRPSQFEELPLKKDAECQGTDYTALLEYIILKSATCRSQIASVVLDSTDRTPILRSQLKKHNLAVAILNDTPSLQDISSRLENAQCKEDPKIEEFVEARRAIAWATAEISLYLQNQIGDVGDDMERERSEIITSNSDTPHKLNQLEDQARSESVNESYSDLDDCNYASSEFEDIDAYSQPVDEKYNEYLQFDDNASVTSIRTI